MKIIIFCAYFYPHQGGVEKYVEELFSEMKNIEVTIVTANTENSKEHEQYRGFDIYRLPCWHLVGQTYPVIKPAGWKKLSEISKNNKKYDYVITNSRFFNTSLLGTIFAKKNNIPLIHIEHGTKHSPVPNPISRIIGIIYDHTFGRYIIKHAEKVAGISVASEKFIKHLYKRDTILIRNSINTEKFVRSKNTDKIRKELKLKNERIILYVGRLIQAKGVQDLLEATKDRNDIKIIIIGSGNYLENLRKISNNAVFLGQKNSDEIIKYLNITDIFVNPSYAEGLPTSVLEAGAMGVPIIATDVGGTKEIIDDNINGFLIKSRDINILRKRITTLLNNSRLRDKFSRNIRKKIASEFDCSVTRQKFLKIVK